MERGTRVLHLVTSVTHVTGYMINQVTLGDPILSTICGDEASPAHASARIDCACALLGRYLCIESN